MTYKQLLALILARAKRLGLFAPETGMIDAADVEMCLYSQLLDLLGHYDLDAYTVINHAMFQTTVGVDTYALPDDFARFVTPHDRDETGLGLDDGQSQQPSPLSYRRPEEFDRLRSQANARPRYFTIAAHGQLRLDPPPDSNNSANYTGTGIYIRDITPDELESGLVPLGYANALQHAVLAELALDQKHQAAQLLLGEKASAVTALVNGQARQRMQFQPKYTQLGRRKRAWR